jgi:serine/threonine-protein kinase
VHRDVKPANILVRATRERRTALLTDFGLAKRLGEPDLTRMGVVIGSPAYLAPEAVDSAEATYEADVYALGVTVYEVLAGHRPFTGSTGEVLSRQRFDEPARPPEVSDDAWRFLSACLAKDPGERPTATEASEVLHDLVRDVALVPSVVSTSGADPSPRDPFSQFGSAAAESSVVTMTSARRPEPAPPPPAPRRHPRLLLIALVATVVVGAGIGALIALSPMGDGTTSPSPPTTSSGTPESRVYRVPITLVTDPEGGATVSWPEESTRLPGLRKFVVMQGGTLRAEVAADDTSYRDSRPLSSGCYFVIALEVTATPIDPAPRSACPTR